MRVPRACSALLSFLLCAFLAACGSAGTNHATSTAIAPAAPGSVNATLTPRAAAAVPATAAAKPKNPTLLLSTTTSTQDSGLLEVLIPLFEQQTGYQVKTQAVGSGQALQLGAMGEADVLLVHSPAAELDFMAKNQGINRRLVMHNDFIIVGPASDPARIKGMTSALAALKTISSNRAPFISRGDNSGTNALELQLWQQAGINTKGQSWYSETGTGMGDTLTTTAEKNAYTISDRATYLATQKTTQLALLVEKDPVLLNIYHVIQVNPANHDGLNVEGAQAFDDFMVAPSTQQVIAAFGKDKYGQALFIADAAKTDAELQNSTPAPVH